MYHLSSIQFTNKHSTRAPVWTAFITDEIRSRSWARMSNADPEAVILHHLQRSIFADSDYTPLKTRRGEDVLKFTTKRG